MTSNHRNVVHAVALWGQMIDAAAIFPLDAASHCGYEEENKETSGTFLTTSTHFSPLGKPLYTRHSVCESTLYFSVVNCSVSGLI